MKEHKEFPVSAGVALGYITRIPRNRTGNVWERDQLGNWLAFGDYHRVTVFLCHKRVQDRLTRAIGLPLPDMQLRHMYEKTLHDEQYEQSFRIIMFGMAPVNPRYDAIRTGAELDRLFQCSMIKFEQAEYMDVLHNKIVPEVQAFMSDPDCTLRNWASAIGRPVESEVYGKGAILADMRTTVRRTKGGLFERRIHTGDLRLA